MDMSQDLIKQIASMLTGDPNVVVKPQMDPDQCPVSADDVEDTCEDVVVPPEAASAEEACEEGDVVVTAEPCEPCGDDYGVPVGVAQAQCGDDSGDMDLQNCEQINEYSKIICDILHSGCCLDEWMQQKLTVCKTYISDIKHALEFKKKHHS